MSLMRFALRRTAVAALRARTLAADRVYDSENTPLAEALKPKDGPRPYVVVFTDTDNRIEMGDTEFYSARRNLSLVLEIGVAAAVQDTKGAVEIRFPATDSGMEAAVDWTSHQAIGAIVGDPKSQWAELMRLMVMRIERVTSVRGAQAGRGVRYSARQLTLVLDIVSDPAPGTFVPAEHPLNRFVTLARANPDDQNLDAADMIEKLMTQPDEVGPLWEQAQAWLGLTKRGIRATGMAPLADTPAGGERDAVEDGDDIVDPVTREGPRLADINITDDEGGPDMPIVPGTDPLDG
jgi:hypothetical protein